MKPLYFLIFLSAFAMADDANLEKLFHDGNNKLTGNMFSEVVKENKDKSVILSAYSVMTPLAQLAFAAVGPSHDELLNAIGLPNDNVTRSVFSMEQKKLKTIEGVELKTANKVYIPLNYDLNPTFAAVSRDVFNSEVANVDFLKNEETAQEINAWVEDQTNHRIKDLVDPQNLGPDTRAVLVNALYFKGSWVKPFDKTLTENKDFHVSKEKVVKVPMMHRRGDYKYYESETLQSKLLKIPYVGDKTSMLIVLPNNVDGIESLLEKLKDLSVVDEAVKHMDEIEVEVSIPKFKIETSTDLKRVLQAMNVEKIFSPEAKLDNLLTSETNLYVSSATQKAFIEVNEEGAEAAAANQFGIAFLSALIQSKEYSFIADHPFVFFLQDNNNFMFIGAFYG